MPRTSSAFNWVMYVALVSFITWGVCFEALQMNLFDTSPVSKTVMLKKKAADVSGEKKDMRLPMKPAGEAPSGEARFCKLTHYDGNASVKGWYEQEEIYGEKTLVLKVADTDRAKLPEKVQKWADGTPLESIILTDVNVELKKLLIQASAEKPTTVDLVSIDVYCEGPPMATVAQK